MADMSTKPEFPLIRPSISVLFASTGPREASAVPVGPAPWVAGAGRSADERASRPGSGSGRGRAGPGQRRGLGVPTLSSKREKYDPMDK
jgi:hypothetical protein